MNQWTEVPWESRAASLGIHPWTCPGWVYHTDWHHAEHHAIHTLLPQLSLSTWHCIPATHTHTHTGLTILVRIVNHPWYATSNTNLKKLKGMYECVWYEIMWLWSLSNQLSSFTLYMFNFRQIQTKISTFFSVFKHLSASSTTPRMAGNCKCTCQNEVLGIRGWSVVLPFKWMIWIVNLFTWCVGDVERQRCRVRVFSSHNDLHTEPEMTPLW